MKTVLLVFIAIVICQGGPSLKRVIKAWRGDTKVYFLTNVHGYQLQVALTKTGLEIKAKIPNFEANKEDDADDGDDDHDQILYLISDEIEVETPDPKEYFESWIKNIQSNSSKVGHFYETDESRTKKFRSSIDGSSLNLSEKEFEDHLAMSYQLQLLDDNTISWQDIGFLNGQNIWKTNQIFRIDVRQAGKKMSDIGF